MPVKKTRKENPFLKPKTPKPKKEEEEKSAYIHPVPSIVPRKWHPAERKDKSLFADLAEALEGDLFPYDERCRRHDLSIWRRVFR